MSPVSFILPIAQYLWGMFVRHHPKMAKVPNSLIPWTNALAALVVQIAASPAQASTHDLGVIAVAPWLASFGHFLAPVAKAAWESIQVSLVYEIFGKKLQDAVLTKPS
jgi:hypothetical protein